MLDNDGAHQAGRFIDVALDGDSCDHVAEFNLAAFISQNWNVVRVPLHEGFTLLHLGAVIFRNHRADDHVVTLELAAFSVMDADRSVFGQDDPTAVQRLDGAQIVELHPTVVLGFDNWLFKCLARGSADVECPHRQLRSRFANRLGSDNSDCFAHFDELTGGEIASVTHPANPAPAFAGQHGTNLQGLHADALQVSGDLLVDELVRFDNLLLLLDRVRNRLATHAADDALAKVDDFFVALINRADDDSVNRAAILYVDDHVLGRINELAGQVTGVGGFQRRIGQTFTRAV